MVYTESPTDERLSGNTNQNNSVIFAKPEPIRSQIKRLDSALARHSEAIAFTGAVAGALMILAIDFAVPAEIRLHGLYVFPLAIVARYCAQLRWSMALLCLTSALLYMTFSFQVVAAPSLTSDVGVPFATGVLTLFLARAWRMSYLKVVNQATTDPLTGVANRRAFCADLASEIARQKHSAGNFTLAVLDLDGFKVLNDSKGHRAGDEALKLVADVLRAQIRKSDRLGRIGGDEFGILMPGAERDYSGFMRDICATIARTTAAVDCGVTASIGCKTFRSPPEDTAAALQQADEIMYAAKLRGKNCAAQYIRRPMDEAANS